MKTKKRPSNLLSLIYFFSFTRAAKKRDEVSLFIVHSLNQVKMLTINTKHATVKCCLEKGREKTDSRRKECLSSCVKGNTLQSGEDDARGREKKSTRRRRRRSIRRERV